MVTFAVDDVTPAAERLTTRALGGLFEDALVIGGDPDLAVVEPDGIAPLLSAVARAFADHRPLVLTPDAVWLTIAQGVAQHVRLHAEELRGRLVGHTGRKRLTVTWPGAQPEDADSWHDLVASLHKLLADEARHADLFECDFSTSTEVDRTAGRVVLLDAYSPYFAYWIRFVCGIPSVTLTGTVADWQKIRDRVDAIADFGLSDWCRSLAPIADEFVQAAAGNADVAFWRRILNPIDAYGGEVVTGWVARFYPYLKAGGSLDSPNPLLECPIGEPRDATPDKRGFYHGPGVRTSSVPATVSRVIVNVNDQVTGDNRVLALHAGVVAVAQQDDGALRPVAGWHLMPAAVEIDDVLDRVEKQHLTTPPEPVGFSNLPAELFAIYRRFGSAQLFGGGWRFLPVNEHSYVDRSGWDGVMITKVADISGGRSLCAVQSGPEERVHWISCRCTCRRPAVSCCPIPQPTFRSTAPRSPCCSTPPSTTTATSTTRRPAGSTT